MPKTGEKHWAGSVAQKAIIVKDGKVLIQQSPLHTEWDLPGGRLNNGELPEEGIIREVKEEIGVNIILDGIITAYTFDIPTLGEHLFVIYTATLEDPSKEFVLEEVEVAKTRWISKEDFNDAGVWPGVRPALEKFFKNFTT